MKFGLFLPNFGIFGDPRTLAEWAKDAEEAGWDGFFIWDHVQRPTRHAVVDPWIALSAIAMSTQRIQFGAMVTPLARRRPWKVARECVSLDWLSDGRLIFGAGLGSGRVEEWANFNEEIDPRIRAGMLDEALNIVVGLWSGEPFGYDGEHYQVAETQFLPRPIQQPRIPIWIAGHWNGKNKAAFRRAARWDGVFGLMRGQGQSPVEQFREMVAYVVQHRTSDAPFEIVYQGSATPGDDAARGAEIVAPFAEAGATWWLETISPARWGDDVDWQSEWNADALHERVCQPPPG